MFLRNEWDSFVNQATPASKLIMKSDIAHGMHLANHDAKFQILLIF